MLLSEHVHCVAERAEQQICIIFCIKLEISSVETIQMIEKAFGDDTLSTTKTLKVVENLLKVIYFLEGPQQAEHLRMVNV